MSGEQRTQVELETLETQCLVGCNPGYRVPLGESESSYSGVSQRALAVLASGAL